MRDKPYTKTHRCPELLKQQCSIRYGEKWSYFKGKDIAWYLRSLEFDTEYDTYSLSGMIEVKYCPCCGEELI